jgi:quinol monooxygenase YgiN
MIRVVKMEFAADKVSDFLSLFEERRTRIRNVAGCTHLELWRDKHNPTVFFTYSHWQDESYLDAYRHSDFFQETWQLTKALFVARPLAWSIDNVM